MPCVIKVILIVAAIFLFCVRYKYISADGLDAEGHEGTAVVIFTVIGAVVLSPGYYAFGAVNGLMVANGMVFIRAASASGSQLLALGL